MKKILLAVAVLAMLGIGTSCQKQKTCVCDYTISVLGVETTLPLGEKVIESGSCHDLENAGAWNAQVGNLASATIHCVQK